MTFLCLYAVIRAVHWDLLTLLDSQREGCYEVDMLGYAIENVLYPEPGASWPTPAPPTLLS